MAVGRGRGGGAGCRKADLCRQSCFARSRAGVAGFPFARTEFTAGRPGHDRRYAIDPSKLETELGWRPAESFDTGLARTVDWYLDNPDWWRPLRDKVYAGERLGLPGSVE